MVDFAVGKRENFDVGKCDWHMSKKMPIFASKNK
jgi:hypothetical protein